jgi:cyanophycin synthetase
VGEQRVIRIVEQRRAFWRNRFSPTPLFYAHLSLDAAFDPKPLAEPLLKCLRNHWPDLVPDGINDAADLIGRVAHGLSRENDDAANGYEIRERDPATRSAFLVLPCRDHFLAEAALDFAVRIVDRMLDGSARPERFGPFANATVLNARMLGLDQSTRAMLVEAERRGVPWTRATRTGHHVLAGQGVRQQIVRETLRSAESAVGRELARNKILTLSMLAPLRLPVGQFTVVQEAATALKAAEQLGYPLVLKPTVGEKGNGVFSGLRGPDDLRRAFDAIAAAKLAPQQYLLQTFFTGDDHRLLVVDGKFVAGARRVPASVTGDGKKTIRELIAEANRDPRRGVGYTRLMNLIVPDGETDRILTQQGLRRESVPKAGQTVRLKATANISTGGTAVDVTAVIHPDNIRAAERAARALELKVAGVDFIISDIARSWHEVGGGICEVNSIVGLRPHWLANPEQNVVAPIFDLIAPAGESLRIPTAMITGTKGKTTTTLMLRAILAAAGHCVGSVTTDGVSVAGEEIASGDFAGYTGASIVLRDPTVTAAVLETARGGILKNGIFLDRCDVACLLNIDREQIGMDGVETLDDMVAVKRKVLDTATEAVVLNAEDPYCRTLAREFRERLRTIVFAFDPDEVRRHCRRGGEAVVVHDNVLVHLKASASVPLLAVGDIPATMNGLLRANIANAMAAAGMALGMNVAPDHIRRALSSFANAPGRFTFCDDWAVRTLFDRAEQAPAFSVVAAVTDQLEVAGKRICAFAGPGNRPDSFFSEGGAALAGHFDRYVCFEREDRRRGKPQGEIGRLFAAGLKAAGVPDDKILVACDETEAARLVAAEATKDDFVAVLAFHDRRTVDVFREAFKLVPAKRGQDA